MRLTLKLISSAPKFLNAIDLREIDLRSNHISSIENIQLIAESVEVVDLSCNDITHLDGLTVGASSLQPHSPLGNLKVILLSHNKISRVDPEIAALGRQQLPHLVSLNLSHNHIAHFDDLLHLSSLSQLRFLSLQGNPVARLPGYRLRVARLFPRLKWLDFQKVTQAERKAAARLAIAPAADHDASLSASPAAAALLSDTQKQLLRTALSKVTSLDQLLGIEASLVANTLDQELSKLNTSSSSSSSSIPSISSSSSSSSSISNSISNNPDLPTLTIPSEPSLSNLNEQSRNPIVESEPSNADPSLSLEHISNADSTETHVSNLDSSIISNDNNLESSTTTRKKGRPSSSTTKSTKRTRQR